MEPARLPFEATFAGLVLLLACCLLLRPVHSALASVATLQANAGLSYADDLHPRLLHALPLRLADLRPAPAQDAELHLADLRPAAPERR